MSSNRISGASRDPEMNGDPRRKVMRGRAYSLLFVNKVISGSSVAMSATLTSQQSLYLRVCVLERIS